MTALAELRTTQSVVSTEATVHRRVVDLDGDEDGPGGRGAEARRPGEAGGGDRHVGLLVVAAGRVSGDIDDVRNPTW